MHINLCSFSTRSISCLSFNFSEKLGFYEFSRFGTDVALNNIDIEVLRHTRMCNGIIATNLEKEA